MFRCTHCMFVNGHFMTRSRVLLFILTEEIDMILKEKRNVSRGVRSFPWDDRRLSNTVIQNLLYHFICILSSSYYVIAQSKVFFLVLVFKMCLRHWSVTSFLVMHSLPDSLLKKLLYPPLRWRKGKNKEKSTQCNTTGSSGFWSNSAQKAITNRHDKS